MKTKSLLFFIAIAFVSCGSHTKTAHSTVKSQKLDDLIEKKSVEIVSDWALPMASSSLNSIANAGLLGPGNSAGRINLIGNSNYMRIKGDSVSAYLPYFGERQMGGGYDSDNGNIQFEGVPENYEITQDEQTKRYEIHFEIKRKAETFTVGVTLMPNLTSAINVSSSQRFPIRYQGRVSEISKEK